MTSQKIKSEIFGMENMDPNIPVHPTFLYESLWNVCAFLILIWFRKRKKLGGEVFFLYMILYGVGRAWIEGLRTDSLYLGGLRISQVLAVLLAVGFSVIFVARRKQAAESNDDTAIVETSEYGEILKNIKDEEHAAIEKSDRSEQNTPEPETELIDDRERKAEDSGEDSGEDSEEDSGEDSEEDSGEDSEEDSVK